MSFPCNRELKLKVSDQQIGNDVNGKSQDMNNEVKDCL